MKIKNIISARAFIVPFSLPLGGLGWAFIFAFLVACENDITVVNSMSYVDEKALPSETSKNVEFLYSDSAKVRSKLVAAQIDRYTGQKAHFEMPKGMKVIFYTLYPKEQTRLTADYGIGYDNNNGMERMEAQRNVVVINEKGDRLNTEHLTGNALTKKIYTDKFVKITTKDEVIWGDGLEANQDFSEYEIKNVKGQINIKDSIQ